MKHDAPYVLKSLGPVYSKDAKPIHVWARHVFVLVSCIEDALAREQKVDDWVSNLEEACADYRATSIAGRMAEQARLLEQAVSEYCLARNTSREAVMQIMGTLEDKISELATAMNFTPTEAVEIWQRHSAKAST